MSDDYETLREKVGHLRIFEDVFREADTTIQQLTNENERLMEQCSVYHHSKLELVKEFNELEDENKALREALTETADMLAFIVNHVELHGFYERTNIILEEGREALAKQGERE